MKIIKFTSYLFLFFVIIFILNLGNFLDITTTPKKSDIIVSLGGDNGNRIKKTLELYEHNLSKSGKLILTGVDGFDSSMKLYELDWRISYLIKKGIKKDNIVINDKASNTLEEIRDIKSYLIQKKYHNVMFISDPPHSRRLSFFINNVFKYNDSDITYQIVASKATWWDRDSYYTNPEAIIFAINETIKLTYYYINYKLGKYDEY